MKGYRITLDVLTAVHIGNGNSLTKKDFEVRGDHINIYNPVKLHSILRSSYEDFLLTDYTLTDFINRSRRDVSEALEYSLLAKGTSIRKRDNIDEFIKDPHGLPYIPGTSLKGAIRTAILSYLVNENKNRKYDSFINSAISKWNANNIEKNAFRDIKESIFKGIRVSDSAPLKREDLILCKKMDIFKDGNTNNKLNLCRESLKPGTKVAFTLTIDKGLFHDGHTYDIDFIKKAIDHFTDQYTKEYLSKFQSFNNEFYSERILYLGGGTGFLTKTINQSLYGKRTVDRVADYFDSQRRFKRHNHFKDKALGVSPRALKCTIINGKTQEMGICSIRID